MELFDNLWAAAPIEWSDGDAGLTLPSGQHSVLKVKAGQTTWMNRANWFCHKVESSADHEQNKKSGFAMCSSQ